MAYSYNQIKFDKCLIDTTLATDYFATKKISGIHSLGYKNNNKIGIDAHKNVIHFSDYENPTGVVVLLHNVSEVPKKLFDLAKKVEENIELFAQLEYLLRDIPIADTKNVDLPLLINNLLYYSSSNTNRVSIRYIIMNRDTPLFNLGCVAQALMSRLPSVVIESTKDTAIVCHLFADLCQKVGLKEKVKLVILEEMMPQSSSKVASSLNRIEEFEAGCVGIVTSKADIDSAVETFLSATTRFPWTIKRILIQECVQEQFKKAISWKCRQSPQERKVSEKLNALCTEIHSCNGKLFLYEFVGTKLDKECEVTVVDTYRTTKDLINQLGESRYLSVSLWCSDIAEANEIAFHTDTTIIWVNDFCNFKGPPKSSQALFSIINSFINTGLVEHIAVIDEVTELREAWLKLDMTKRENIIRAVLSDVPSQLKPGDKKVDVEDIDFSFDSFLSVDKSSLCFGTEMIPGLMDVEKVDIDVVKFIVRGGGVMLLPKNDYSKRIFEVLREKGAPIAAYDKFLKYGTTHILSGAIYRMKVVWSNFGTIFAN